MTRLLLTAAFSAVFLAAGCATIESEIPKSNPDKDAIQVMVLGAYHFDNPGRDVFNVEVGSVLTPERQAEIEGMSACLLTFNPTKIAIERDGEGDSVIDAGYLKFTPDMLSTNANEITQIGYRLAYMSGHDTVYAIDEQPEGDDPDYFPYQTVTDHITATGQDEAFAKFNAGFGAEIQKFSDSQSTQTIPGLMLDVNDGFLSSPDFYFHIMDFDIGETQPAAELNAYYYMRNAKIVSKLRDAAQPGDRIIIVYGAGHKYFLDTIIAATPGYESVDPVPYLKKAVNGTCK
ncbi:DUF5694 domain-containing protein [Robiginitomaculum antarcticum]|uniref:DUF5694 domain-containing protein n=1 Tax=Robiginitomaculum antarcticum TaxID=437507 RepID=UPI0003775D31|nr:DUF5694 domain-containing protein [Robiginitomaculum antarcticum]